MCRADRKACEEELISVTVYNLKRRAHIDLSSFRKESVVLKIKLGISCITVGGIYRPPDIAQPQ